ncbi:hypothetical protein ZIOFF_016686 [Zingiber officinale]|uniref:Uncharacterized protein n=1 Tax=Zingiber officinale TaxID=94328 RepID=A0A8J5HLV7_ZINOF|nr:hypothetical protein ZIOFF_016686 [Zingiber officinale]
MNSSRRRDRRRRRPAKPPIRKSEQQFSADASRGFRSPRRLHIIVIAIRQKVDKEAALFLNEKNVITVLHSKLYQLQSKLNLNLTAINDL